MSKKQSARQEEVVEDYLDEDTEIPGQRYVLLSFVSPEKVLEKKEFFFFQKFMQLYEVDWKIKNLEKFLMDTAKGMNAELDEKAAELEKADQVEAAQICRKNRLNVESILGSYSEFIKKSRSDLTKTKIAEAYDDFIHGNKSKLEEEFFAANDFKTSMRGIKVRGVFSNQKEAEIKAKKLQNKDKYHNIYMAEMGKWTPWDPNPNEIQDQEYNNDQLNNLMRKYKENEDSREKFFEERTKSNKAAGAPIASTASSSSSNGFDSMFGGQGDIALQRKMEKPVMTMSKVSEDEKGDEKGDDESKK